MSAIGPKPLTAVNREEGDIIFYRVEELKDKTAETVREKARHLNKTINEWELTTLLVQGFKEFTAKVNQEYAQTPYADLAQMLIPSHKMYFLSDKGLIREIRQIVS